MTNLLLILLLLVGCETPVEADSEAPSVIITSPINETTLSSTTIVKIDAIDNETISKVSLKIQQNYKQMYLVVPHFDIQIL